MQIHSHAGNIHNYCVEYYVYICTYINDVHLPSVASPKDARGVGVGVSVAIEVEVTAESVNIEFDTIK